MIRKFLNRRGSASVWLCVFLAAASMVLSLLFLFLLTVQRVSFAAKRLQTELDDAVSQYASIRYETLKSGEDPGSLDDLRQSVLSFLQLDGGEREISGVTVSRPALETTDADGHGVILSVHLSVPVYFFGVRAPDAVKDMTFRAEYRSKTGG